MKKGLDQSVLDELVMQATKKKNIFGASICVEKGDGSISLVGHAGNLADNPYYFIASVTKLYVTAVMLKLRSMGELQLEDKISNYLSSDNISNLHVYNGVDYSKKINIKHLMSNTSGIPDYFDSKVSSDLLSGVDQAWPLEKTLEIIKRKSPKFVPGQKGKAQYSDTNYQLLGRIIENVTGMSIHDVFKEFIFTPLSLEETYVYADVKDNTPVPIHYKEELVHVPIYMASIAAEGGIVSTARDTMKFFRAFYHGDLFPKQDLKQLVEWNLIFGPGLFYYGIGISRQPLSPFALKKGLIGHWGHTGAFAFYHPETDLYFTGTINQFTGHAVAVQLMRKIINRLK